MSKVDASGIEVADVTLQMSHRGSKARSIAVRSVVNNEAFFELPKVGTDGELTIGYLRNMKHKLSKRIGLEMLVEDLLHIDTTLRPKLLQNIEDLDDTRYSSLLYLSLAVGVDKVLKNAEIWRALRSADYVAAQWAMLRMYWAYKVVPSDDKKAQTRLMMLSEMMRTGEEQTAAA